MKTLFDVEPNVYLEEDLGGYRRITGEFWTARQRQMHSIHYAVSYRASFKPELPNYFINRFCTDANRDTVFDPFGGRGTTTLEANLLGFAGISNDVNPLSEKIARPKTRPVSINELREALDAVDFEQDVDVAGYETTFAPFFHIDTFREMVALKNHLSENRSDADRFIEMIALSRLHGHSDGFFSVYSFPQISVSPQAQANINVKRNQTPDFRPIKPRILRKAKKVLRDLTELDRARLRSVSSLNRFTTYDSGDLESIADDAVALIVTSPPFLNIADYVQDNWLEFWFTGIDSVPLRSRIVMTKDLDEWSSFMKRSMEEMIRVLRPAGVAVIEVGEVKYKGRRLNLDEVVAEIAKTVGFQIVEVLINLQQFTKLANCFNVDNNAKGTNTNRLVLLKKP